MLQTPGMLVFSMISGPVCAEGCGGQDHQQDHQHDLGGEDGVCSSHREQRLRDDTVAVFR